jgi:hypothetical protein
MLEIKAKRTKYTKTFHTGKNRRMLYCSPYPLHFWNGEKWQGINLKPSETESGYVLETPYYKFEFQKFPFKIIFNDQWVRNLDSPQTAFTYADGNTIEIREIFKGVDLKIKLFSESVSLFFSLKEGKYEFNWKSENGDFEEVHNYDVPMTVKSIHFGAKAEWIYPETSFEGTEEFRKCTKSDHFEDLPALEIYYVT